MSIGSTKKLPRKVKVTKPVRKTIDGPDGAKVEQTVEETVEEIRKRVAPGYLESVYHLYSTALRARAPLCSACERVNRTDQVDMPSLTPVWRSAEFQEREVFDLYGIIYTGHPDLRRILMWDEFKDHPMRRDYVEPDDFEYEPTPHDAVLKRAQEHKSSEQGIGSRE